ncbi:hypothetical protein Tco_0092141 [Tanacetum coccineum]
MATVRRELLATCNWVPFSEDNKSEGASSETGSRRKAFESLKLYKDRTTKNFLRLEELRFLATSTKDLGQDGTPIGIKKQKKLIKNKMKNDLGDEDDEDEDE